MRPALVMLLALCMPLPWPTLGDDAESPAIQSDAALAVVNGIAISRESFAAEFRRVAAYSRAADRAALALDILHGLIDAELIRQFAAAQGITVEAAAVENEIARMHARLGAQGWESWLRQNHYTASEFPAALQQHFLVSAVREHVLAFLHEPVLHARARHNLAARLSEAQSLLARLRAGADFATLAAEHSRDVSTREAGGDLGWFIQGELLEEALNQAAFSQALGDIPAPIATRLGYHLLQVSERAMREIESERLPWLSEIVFARWLEARREAADIEINMAALDLLIAATP